MRELRKANRFELKLPLRLVRVGSQHISKTVETKNVSSLGVLFINETPLTIGESIEYVITLPAQIAGAEVSIRCLGKVVRHQPIGDAEPQVVATAATLERYEFLRQPQ